MRRTVVLLILALAMAACQAAKPDPAAVSQNRAAYDQLRAGNIEAVVAQLPPGANNPGTVAVVAKLRSLIPPSAPLSSIVLATPMVVTSAGRAQAVVVEYDYPDRTTRFETVAQQPNGKTGWSLQQFRLRVASHRELAPNGLTLDHRSPAQLAYFALAISSPLLMIAALIKVLRTPGLANRGLWAAFAFVGLFSFQMNWATGALLVQWMSLQIIGFWMSSSPSQYDPWIISATVPIGALLILAGLVAKPATAPRA